MVGRRLSPVTSLLRAPTVLISDNNIDFDISIDQMNQRLNIVVAKAGAEPQMSIVPALKPPYLGERQSVFSQRRTVPIITRQHINLGIHNPCSTHQIADAPNAVIW